MIESRTHETARSSWPRILGVFLKLGLTSFGGPVAHLGFFRDEFVKRRSWLDEKTYADLVALCQFLPGPASSQLGFAVGLLRGGWMGGLAAWVGFTLPSFLIMIAVAYGIAAAGDISNSGWVHGLKVTTVAVVAQAVWRMSAKLCPDRARVLLALSAAVFVLSWRAVWSHVVVIVLGGMAGWILFRNLETFESPRPAPFGFHPKYGAACLATFFGLLLGLPLLAAAYPSAWLAVFDSFYRSGSLVFGGGHVVLPLLQAEVVPRGWVSNESFLAGYGTAQALPGPLFTFAAYLGAVMKTEPKGWIGGLWCLAAIFLPAILLVAGVLPFWERLREKSGAQAMLMGANAAVVGLLLAALCHPVGTSGIRSVRDLAVALAAFGLLEWSKAPPWLVVILAAAAGQALL